MFINEKIIVYTLCHAMAKEHCYSLRQKNKVPTTIHKSSYARRKLLPFFHCAQRSFGGLGVYGCEARERERA